MRTLFLETPPKVIAALASLVPLYISLDSMERRGRGKILEKDYMKALVAYGVAYGTTGDTVSAVIALLVVAYIMGSFDIEKIFRGIEKDFQDDKS